MLVYNYIVMSGSSTELCSLVFYLGKGYEESKRC
jgi:hypothetical protein